MSERRASDPSDPSAPLMAPAPKVSSAVATAASTNGAPGEGPRESQAPPSDGRERRSYERFEVTWSVDCETEDTFLYASIKNISEMGIFVRTIEPLPVGTHLTLRFAKMAGTEAFVLRGTVQWINVWRPASDNPNPGMGIRFVDLAPADRERIVDTIRTIAYLREP